MVLILITAGPTREHIDDVRFLSNGSSGRMGCALAAAALADGHEAVLVLGPVEIEPPAGARVHRVVSALEMKAVAEAEFAHCAIAIAAAAVADWRPKHRASGKPARSGDTFALELVPNPDIVKGLAEHKDGRIVAGFALESEHASREQAVARGREKLRQKRLDFVVCNRSDAIGRDRSEAVLVFADGREETLPAAEKSATARAIVRAAVALWQQSAAEPSTRSPRETR